ncbi:unnamed protein product [Ostreobium quekettii]|uniref:Homeobox domain-containing protein n=1 Tax=Ostreobium quekettii TaxID=121088 RepID=A0A8S1J9Z1_9CHLO|nr:unnamed protein product [Ostreobium quekettii]|eukprot:evm.model.scf_940.3 EVM.evm.TU.scf_940.3   scf_940:24282-26824(+)
MSNQVEVADAVGLMPAGGDMEGGSPTMGSLAPDVGQHQASVSTLLSSLLGAGGPVGALDQPGGPKVLGLPAFQIENGPADHSGVPQLYLESASGGPVEVRGPAPLADGRQQMAHSCDLAAQEGGLDFAPVQTAMGAGPRASCGLGPVVQDLALARSTSADAGVLAAAALQSLPDSSVLFAGVDRQLPESVVTAPGARLDGDGGRALAVDPRTGHVHLVVQDLQALPNKGFALPVKVENRIGSPPARGVAVPDLRHLSNLVSGVAGQEASGGVGAGHLLHHHAVHQPQMQRPHKPTRWKPNSAQLCLLERHFNSGYKRPTPELYAAVKGAGEAKEAQVSVWLKNRLARSKDRSHQGTKPSKPPESGPARGPPCCAGPDRQSENLLPMLGQKRAREEDEEESWDDYQKMSQAALREVASAMAAVDGDEVSQLVKDVCSARKVCCYGVGRERLVMKALALRLCHMGLDACVVGEANTPVVGKGDLLMASAGPSYYNTVNAICLAAIRANTRVVAFTAHQTAPLPFADKAVRIPIPFAHPIPSCGHKGPKSEVPNGEAHKIMQLGSAFEVALWMMFECMCVMIQRKLGVQEADMVARQTNLEAQLMHFHTE